MSEDSSLSTISVVADEIADPYAVKSIVTADMEVPVRPGETHANSILRFYQKRLGQMCREGDMDACNALLDYRSSGRDIVYQPSVIAHIRDKRASSCGRGDMASCFALAGLLADEFDAANGDATRVDDVDRLIFKACEGEHPPACDAINGVSRALSPDYLSALTLDKANGGHKGLLDRILNYEPEEG